MWPMFPHLAKDFHPFYRERKDFSGSFGNGILQASNKKVKIRKNPLDRSGIYSDTTDSQQKSVYLPFAANAFVTLFSPCTFRCNI